MSEQFVDKRGWKIWIKEGVVNVVSEKGDLEASYPVGAISSTTEDPGITESSLRLCVSGETGADAIESGEWLTYDFAGADTAARLAHAIRVAARQQATTDDEADDR